MSTPKPFQPFILILGGPFVCTWPLAFSSRSCNSLTGKTLKSPLLPAAACINGMKTQPLYTIGNKWERKAPLSSWRFWSTYTQLGIESCHSFHPLSYTVSYKTLQVLLRGSRATVFARQSWLRVQEESQNAIFTSSYRCMSLRTWLNTDDTEIPCSDCPYFHP